MSGYISTADIQTTLDAQLKTISGLPTFSEENQTAKASGSTAWCRSTLASAKSTTNSLGDNKAVYQTGIYQVDLFYPTAYGFSQGRAMSDLIVNAFLPSGPSNPGLLLQDGINRLLIFTAWPLPGRAYPNAGAFWQIPNLVEWGIWVHI